MYESLVAICFIKQSIIQKRENKRERKRKGRRGRQKL